jgi:hypothetical protein
METKVALAASVRNAFSRLIDYAGLFPPAQLSLADAVVEYRRAHRSPHAWMLGRFIIPASLLNDASELLDGPFSVIVDKLDSLKRIGAMLKAGAKIEALEVPLVKSLAPAEIPPAIEELGDDLRDAGISAGHHAGALRVFVEIPRSTEWSELLPRAMSSLDRANLGAKLRCGGVTAEAFPSAGEVADFIAAASSAHVPFKATAGLHHPIRHLNETSGFTMHGFLNLLAAAALASVVAPPTLARIVAEEDARAFRFDATSLYWNDRAIDAESLAECRTTAFVAYGSCSFSEPVEDLTTLGILPAR